MDLLSTFQHYYKILIPEPIKHYFTFDFTTHNPNKKLSNDENLYPQDIDQAHFKELDQTRVYQIPQDQDSLQLFIRLLGSFFCKLTYKNSILVFLLFRLGSKCSVS